eukprot:2612293-Rhodomonas_salina.1
MRTASEIRGMHTRVPVGFPGSHRVHVTGQCHFRIVLESKRVFSCQAGGLTTSPKQLRLGHVPPDWVGSECCFGKGEEGRDLRQ